MSLGEREGLMSRSNPHQGTPNPAVRWFEWSGEKGLVRYYDKDAKQTVEVGSSFTFMLLDQLGSVRGWHDPSQSGIYSNEVKDTRQDAMIVKAFKGGTLAEGVYKDIKLAVNAIGGHFNANLYIAFKDETRLEIGSLRFKGAALGAWMEFSKAHRGDIYKKAITIDGFTEGKKGRIVYRMPTFKVSDVSEATNDTAVGLDAELQEWLAGYLTRSKKEQVAQPPPPEQGHDHGEPDYEAPPITDDDIPF
jgi:hypothetical protein